MNQWVGCTGCGQPIIAGALVCQHCGARQPRGQGAATPRGVIICSQCMTTATPDRVRQSGPIGFGLFLCIVSLFFFWPLLLLGLLVMLLSSVLGSKVLKRCRECKSEALVPLHTPAGMELSVRAQSIHQQRLVGHVPPMAPADLVGRPWNAHH
jgi:hypothetical protein